MDKDHVSAFASGEPNTAYPQYFTGQSYLKMLTKGKIPVANVTFEPGCRNHWHIHHNGGQILLCVGRILSGMGTACAPSCSRRCR